MRLLCCCALLVAPLLAQQGKIIFSAAPINLASPGASVASFKAGDSIYGAVILTAPVKTLCAGRTSNNATKEALELKHYIDKNYVDSGFLTVKGAFFSEATSFLLDVAPEPARVTAYKDPNLEYKQFGGVFHGAMQWSQDLGALPPGTHTMRLEVLACSNPIAAGEFRIAGGPYTHYAQLVGALKQEQTKSNGMSAPKKKDPALEATMLKAMKASTSTAWKDEIIRVVILDADWFLERHPISGAILFRYIRAEVAVKTGGGCAFYQLCTFKQDYVGGQFRPVYYDGHGDQIKIPCENVNR